MMDQQRLDHRFSLLILMSILLSEYPVHGRSKIQGLPPEIINKIDHRNITANVNENVTMPCKVKTLNFKSDPYSQVRFYWKHNDEIVWIQDMGTRILSIENVCLKIINVKPEDVGTWSCHAHNQHGEDMVERYLKVQGSITPTRTPSRTITAQPAPTKKPFPGGDLFPDPPPTVRKRVVKRTGYRGARLKMRCQADGKQLTYLWMKDGHTLQRSKRYSYRNNGKILLVKNFSSSDLGSYQCIASNLYGSANMTFRVRYSPERPDKPDPAKNVVHMRKLVGSNVTLMCTSEKAKLLLWQIPSGSNQKGPATWSQTTDQNQISHDRLYIMNGTRIKRYMLFNVSKVDSGVYRCLMTLKGFKKAFTIKEVHIEVVPELRTMPPQSHQDRQMPLFLLICIPLIAGVICICIVICCWRHHTKSHIRMQSSPLTDTTNHNDPEEDLDAKILGPIPPGSLRRHIATVGNNKNLQSDATGNPATAASSDLQPSDITAPCPTVPPIAGSSGNSVGLGCRFNSASRSFEKISSGLYVSQALADAQSVPVASNLLEPNPHLAHHQLIPPLAPAHHHKCEHKDSGNISVDESAESRAVSPARLSMGGTWPRPVSGRTESSSTRNSSSNRLSAASSMEAAICQRCGGCSNASAVITAASATSGYASSEYFKSSNSSSNLSVNNIRNSYCNGLPPSPTSFSRNSNTNSSPSRNSSNNSYPLPPYNQQLNLSNSSIKSSSRTKFHNNNNNNQIIIPPIKTFVKSKRKSRSNSSVDSSGFCCVNAGVGRSSTNKTERDRAMGCNSCADFAADPEEELPYMHRTILSPCVIDDAQLIISDDGNYKTDGPEEAWQKRRNKKPQQCSSSPDARGKKHHHNCEDEGARTSSCEVGVHLNNFIHSRTRTYSQAEDGGEHADGHAYNDANSDVFGEQLRPATKYEIQCSTSLALTT